MAEWVKTKGANPEDLRLIFKTHTVEGGKKLLISITHVLAGAHVCALIKNKSVSEHTQNNKQVQ